MLNVNGLVLQLASSLDLYLKYPLLACSSENGTRWAVTLGPSGKVTRRKGMFGRGAFCDLNQNTSRARKVLKARQAAKQFDRQSCTRKAESRHS